MSDLTGEELDNLLHLAHQVVIWTTQSIINYEAAGARHLITARQEYYKTRVDAFAAVRALTSGDSGGCTCQGGACSGVDETCLYHYAARLQPWNHHIPWNCPSYLDGCNCEGGPFYERDV